MGLRTQGWVGKFGLVARKRGLIAHEGGEQAQLCFSYNSYDITCEEIMSFLLQNWLIEVKRGVSLKPGLREI